LWQENFPKKQQGRVAILVFRDMNVLPVFNGPVAPAGVEKLFGKRQDGMRLLRGGREIGSIPPARVCLRRIVLQTKFVTANAGHP